MMMDHLLATMVVKSISLHQKLSIQQPTSHLHVKLQQVSQHEIFREDAEKLSN